MLIGHKTQLYLFKDGQRLREDGVRTIFEVDSQRGIFRLRICSVNESDTGFYTLLAQSSGGQTAAGIHANFVNVQPVNAKFFN